jgi:hypothetical protein
MDKVPVRPPFNQFMPTVSYIAHLRSDVSLLIFYTTIIMLSVVNRAQYSTVQYSTVQFSSPVLSRHQYNRALANISDCYVDAVVCNVM